MQEDKYDYVLTTARYPCLPIRMPDTDTHPKLLPIGTVAAAFGVSVPTVRAWGDAGKLSVVRTPGNQRRFLESEISAALAAERVS